MLGTLFYKKNACIKFTSLLCSPCLPLAPAVVLRLESMLCDHVPKGRMFRASRKDDKHKPARLHTQHLYGARESRIYHEQYDKIACPALAVHYHAHAFERRKSWAYAKKQFSNKRKQGTQEHIGFMEQLVKLDNQKHMGRTAVAQVDDDHPHMARMAWKLCNPRKHAQNGSSTTDRSKRYTDMSLYLLDSRNSTRTSSIEACIRTVHQPSVTAKHFWDPQKSG